MIELIVTLAIVAIVIGMAMPSFQDLIKNARMKTEANGLVSAISYARTEAVKLGRWVTLCARNDDTSCGADWNNGWLLFMDATGTNIQGNGIYESATDKIIKIRSDTPPQPAITTSGGFNHIRFMPAGTVSIGNPPMFFKFCDDRTGNFGRTVDIRAVGRPYIQSASCP